MMKNLFFKKMLFTAIAMCLTTVVAFAWEGHAPLQAFIDREKSEHRFTEVNNLWTKDNQLPKTMATPYVKDATFFTLDFNHLGQFITENNRCINLVIPNPQGGNYVIELAQYSPFTGSFSVDTDNGARQEKYNYTNGLHYRGVVNNMPGSIAAFSFFNNEVYGIFSIPGVGNISIVPNTMISEDAGIPNYILYNDADLLIAPEGPVCSTDELPDLHSPMKDLAESLGKNVFSTCKEVKIYLRADYETYIDKNSNTTTVTNFVTAIFNVISTIYRNEGIYVALHKIVINTASDEYQSLSTSSSSNFLNKFGQLTQNALQGANLAMLFSTRGGGMGGVAWLDALCDAYTPNGNQHYGPYSFMNINTSGPGAFPTYSWNTAASAHEIGHNLGSPHTHACRWTSTGYTQNGQAIDGCYNQENGPCSLLGPQYPTNGGTVMSYCHLVQGVGVNLSNGFGTAPGNRIRSRVNSNTCPIIYAPNVPMTAVASNANRECTDPNGITYYWYDGVNADTSGDRIILKIKKNSNTIGDLDQTGFVVKSGTLTGYGTGSAVEFTLPTGLPIPTDTNAAMRRYWSMTPITQPVTAVDVYVPFTATDVNDINGSVPGTVTATNLRFYNLTSASADPSPAVFTGVTSSNINLYTNGGVASTTQWQLSPVGTTQYALFKTTKLYGGTGFVNHQGGLNLINTKSGEKMMVYPNPFSDSWNISLPQGENMTLQVYAVDGKMIQTQYLNAGTVNTVNSKALPAGMYFYRITGSAETFTGTIVKE
jgi:hypothetical protein